MTKAIDLDKRTVDRAIEAGRRIVLTRAADNAEQRLACKRMFLKALQAFPGCNLTIRYERVKDVRGEGFDVLVLETRKGSPYLRAAKQEQIRCWVVGYETAKYGDD